MQSAALAGGFKNAPVDAAFAFRAVMSAMARPGTIHDIAGAAAPEPLSNAAATVLLTLCDPDTGVALAGACDTPDVRDWMTFHTGAALVDAQQATFAVGTWADLQPIDVYRIGTPEYPDRSATLIVEMPDLSSIGTLLRGPGIRDSIELALPDADAMAHNAMLFPLGVDFILCAGDRVAAVPRSTQIGDAPCM